MTTVVVVKKAGQIAIAADTLTRAFKLRFDRDAVVVETPSGSRHAAYGAVVSLMPGDAQGRYDLGAVLTALGRHAEAVEQYRQALRQRAFPGWLVGRHRELYSPLLVIASQVDEGDPAAM